MNNDKAYRRLGTFDECAGVREIDGYRRDTLCRFNQSLQHFFDSSAKIETQFAVGAASS